MSPFLEPPKSKSPWWLYAPGAKIAGYPRVMRGCRALLIVFVSLNLLVGILFSGILGPTISGMVGHLINRSHPWSDTVPYKFEYTKSAASCRVKLPNDSGAFTYMHVLGKQERSLTLTTKKYQNRELPLMYSCSEGMSLNIYWYPSLKDKHSYLRLVGPGADSIIDLDRGKSMLVKTKGKSVLASDFNNEYDVCEKEYDTSGNIVDKPKRPTIDLTSTFAGRGKYLGCIVRDGNGLKLVKAP